MCGCTVLLKVMIDKLKLQVLRGQRARFGDSSEQLNSPQIASIEGRPLDELPMRKAAATKERGRRTGERSQAARPPAA